MKKTNKIKKTLLSITLVLTMLLAVACTKEEGSKIDESGMLQEAHEAVKNAYGEDYIPTMPIEEQMLSEIYGVNLEDVEEFIAEGPMISVHIDTFIGIRAKEGKADEVEKALNEYREKLINESFQYPMNLPKLNASTVYKTGNHVFFIMLGKMNEATDVSEQEALDFAKAENQRGIDAINTIFK